MIYMKRSETHRSKKKSKFSGPGREIRSEESSCQLDLMHGESLGKRVEGIEIGTGCMY